MSETSRQVNGKIPDKQHNFSLNWHAIIRQKQRKSYSTEQVIINKRISRQKCDNFEKLPSYPFADQTGYWILPFTYLKPVFSDGACARNDGDFHDAAACSSDVKNAVPQRLWLRKDRQQPVRDE